MVHGYFLSKNTNTMNDSRHIDDELIIKFEAQIIALRNQADALLQYCHMLKKQYMAPTQQQKSDLRATIINRSIKSYHKKSFKK